MEPIRDSMGMNEEEPKLGQADAGNDAARLLQVVADGLPVQVAYVDRDHRYRYVNRSCEAYYRRPRGEIVGRHVRELLGETAYAETRPHIERALAGERVSHEMSYDDPDGTRRVVRVDYEPDRGDGRVRGLIAQITDLTERKREQDALRLERNFTSAVLDSAGALIVVLDREGRIRRFNRACEELSRYAFAEVEGRCVWDFLLLPEERALVREQGFLALAEDPSALSGSHTNYWVAKDGEKRLIEWHNTVLRDDRGRTEYVVSVGIDVTEKRLVEAALKRSEETYARAEAIAHIGSWDWDIRTGGLRWTDEIYRIFGQTPKSFGATYEAFLAAVHPEDRQKVIDAVNASVADPGVPYGVEHRVVRPNGEVRIVHERGKVYRDERGRPLRMIGTVHDVTEQKRAEAELERYREHLEELVRERTAELTERERQLRRAQEIAHLGDWSVNVQTGELHWSDEIYRIFGREPGAYTPTMDRFYEAVHPEDVQRVMQAQERAFAQGEAFRVDHRIVLPDGGIRWVHEEAVTEQDAEGRPLRLAGTVQDISERKAAEGEILRAKDEAERANRAKSEFLSRMSHELRTPMNAILGFTQVLEMQPLDADQREFVGEIHKAGDHLLKLIDELLDLSRIEAGKLSMAIETVDLDSALEQAVQLVQPLLAGKRVSLTRQCPAGTTVLADVTRLRQVLVNLLSNAAKYNRDDGRIVVQCRAVEGERLRVTVSDTGPGIAPEKLARLFTPFERLGAEHTAVQGTGIGLAFTRQLMELMGGAIGAESSPGQGSRFWIELPLAGEAQEARGGRAQPDPEPGTGRIKVLYVEDNVANLRVVEAMFRFMPQLTLLSATDGEYGLELARRHRPDVILLDVHLPGMDGYAVLYALRADPVTRAIPVIALSADAMPLDVERGLEAGFRAYLTKPVKMDELAAALRAVTRATSLPT